jgi:hypothetical protein
LIAVCITLVLFHKEIVSMMKPPFAVGASMAVVLLFGCTETEESFHSGPQAGAMIPGVFHPLNVTGDSAGEKACLV